MSAPSPGGRGRSLNPPAQHRNTATPEGDGKRTPDEARRTADNSYSKAARERRRANGKVNGASARAGCATKAEVGGWRKLHLPDPVPWPKPICGATLLDDISAVVRRYVALSREYADAVALWIVHAHALDATSTAPRLAIVSPVKRCGKTTLLGLVGRLVPRALPCSNITSAALFRAVEKARPTLLIDEADTFLADAEGLRGVLNSGHSRVAAYVVRTVGDEHEPAMFSTWAAIAVAMIGRLPTTLEDRSIVIHLRRRRPDEYVERLRHDRATHLEALCSRAARWASDNMDLLREADPAMPAGLHDRAKDNWTPLLAIADLAGGDWPARARRAAMATRSTEDGDDEAAGIMLLADIRDIFKAQANDRIASVDLVKALVKKESRPWPEWKNGAPITVRQIARLLDPFDIAPGTIRTKSGTIKGYRLGQFSESFSRYAPSNPSQRHKPQRTAGNSGLSIRHTKPRVTDRNSPQPAKPLRRDGVTVRSPSKRSRHRAQDATDR